MRLSNAQGELQPSGHAVTANSLGQLQLDDFKSKQNASATSLIMITDNTNKYELPRSCRLQDAEPHALFSSDSLQIQTSQAAVGSSVVDGQVGGP